VNTLVVVLATAQDNFGGHFIQGQRWERYMDLVLGLGRKGGGRGGGRGLT